MIIDAMFMVMIFSDVARIYLESV